MSNVSSIGIENQNVDNASKGFTKSSFNAQNIALWILQIGAAGMFLMAGMSKLSGAPEMVGLFSTIGMGQWFRYLTGALEVLGGLALLVPFVAGFGALLLSGVMVGAVATHLFILGGSPVMALVLLGVSLIIAASRREQIFRFFKRSA